MFATQSSLSSVLDDALPGAAALFSDQRLTSGVEAAPGPMSVRYLRYKPGVSLTACVDTSSGVAMAYAVAADVAPKLEKVVHRAPRHAVLWHDPQRRWALVRPVADRDLPGIARRAGERATTLSYKPQRRWVGKVDDHADRVLRCYRKEDIAAIRLRWPDPSLGAGTELTVPEVLDSCTRRATLTTSLVAGEALEPGGDGRLDILERAGRSLALWHRLPAPSHPSVSGVGLAVGRLLRTLLPAQSDRLDDLEARLRSLPSTEQHAVWCHGDFSADQLLVDADERICLIDWDRSGAGPRSADLASADAAGLAPAAFEALLTGYTSAADLPEDLTTARALATYSRAAEPFRRAEPQWKQQIAERLHHVEELLG
jgi:hypothetical protein